jgi:hypothetical protein
LQKFSVRPEAAEPSPGFIDCTDFHGKKLHKVFSTARSFRSLKIAKNCKDMVFGPSGQQENVS